MIQQQQPQQNLFSQTSKPGQLFQPSQIKNVPLKGKSNSMNSKQTQDTNLVFEQQNSFFRYNQNQQPTQVPSISNQIQSQNIVNASSYFQNGENTQKFQSREFNVNNNQQTGQSSQQQQILQGLDVLQSNTLSRQRFKNVETLKNQSDPTPMRYTPNSYQPQKDLNQRLQNNLTGGTQLKNIINSSDPQATGTNASGQQQQMNFNNCNLTIINNNHYYNIIQQQERGSEFNQNKSQN